MEQSFTSPAPPISPAVTVPQPVLRPIAEGERIVTMDVLRGFAIFGIFVVNIAFFAQPLSRLLDPTSMADAPAGDRLVHAITRTFFEFKFVSIFSLLFGAGLVMQSMRAAARRAEFTPLYLRRTLILMVIGLMHGLLLWYGDILFIYACVALMAMWFHRAPVKGLLIAGALFIAASILVAAATGILGVLFTAEVDAELAQVEQEPAATEPQTGSEPSAPGTFAAFWDALQQAERGPEDPDWERAEVIAYKEGPMSATLVMRAMMFVAMLVFAGVFGGFAPRVIGMFLIGMALMKMNFFSAARRRWHVRSAVLGLGLGIPAEVLVVWVYYARGYQYGWPEWGVEVLHQAASFILCFGYIGVLALLVDVGLLRRLTGSLAAVGRMALTNYLAQTVVATFLMYWWGLAWFNEVPPTRQALIVVLVFAAQVVLSILWLKVFAMGPIEWLWRSLTYLRPQRALRSAGPAD